MLCISPQTKTLAAKQIGSGVVLAPSSRHPLELGLFTAKPALLCLDKNLLQGTAPGAINVLPVTLQVLFGKLKEPCSQDQLVRF